MSEEKEQAGELEELLRLSPGLHLVSDEEYLRYSGFIERAGTLSADCPRLVTLRFGDRRPPRVPEKMLRGAFGALPRTLMHALGVFEHVLEQALSRAHPVCGRCGDAATPPTTFRSLPLPSEGYLALVVPGSAPDDSLKAWCELLGVERAMVDGHLVPSSDTGDFGGNPVLRVSAADQSTELEKEADAWFSKGGGALTLVFFKERRSHGVTIGEICGAWRCGTCGGGVPVASNLAISSLDPCPLCKGFGWHAADEGRLRACPDCRGYGTLSSFARYSVGGIPLSTVPLLSITEALALPDVVGSAESGPVRALEKAREGGFGDYPLATAIDQLSVSERSRLSLVVCALSELDSEGPTFDALSCGFAGTEAQVALRATSSRAITCPYGGTSRVEANGAPLVSVRDINFGPFSNCDIAVPRHGGTLIAGASGVGKTTLVNYIAARFAKRKKFQATCDFGDLKSCDVIKLDDPGNKLVFDLLDLQRGLSSLLSHSPDAGRRGLTRIDFDPHKSPFLCQTCCASDGFVGVSESCPTCNDIRFDEQVTSLRLGSRSFGELLRLPLPQLAQAVPSCDGLVEAISILPVEFCEELTLGTATSRLSGGGARFLALAGACGAVVASRQKALDRALIMFDGPYGLAGGHTSRILDLCHTLAGKGAAVLWTDNQPGVESAFQYVVPLTAARTEYASRSDLVYADMRFCRTTRIGALERRGV